MARIPESLMLGKSLKNGVGIASGETWPPFQMVYVSGRKQSPSVQRIWVFLHVLWREGLVDSGERVQEAAATFQHRPWSADEEMPSLEFHISAIISIGENDHLGRPRFLFKVVVPPFSKPPGCGVRGNTGRGEATGCICISQYFVALRFRTKG